MTKISVADFKDTVVAAAERRQSSDRDRYLSDRRHTLETSVEGVGLLFAVARLASHFEDFPGFVSLERTSNGHNRGLGLERSPSGVWSLSASDSFLLSSRSVGGGYLGTTEMASYAMEAMGIPHSPEAHGKVAALCSFGPDFGTQIASLAPSLPRHVVYSAMGHGSRFARFIGADKNPMFARTMVDTVLGLGFDIDGRNVYGCTPALTSASGRDDTAFVSELLRRNADPNIVKYGNAPVWAAASECNLNVLTMLAEAGADLGVVNKLDETLLHVAARRLESDAHHYHVPDVVTYLLGKGVNMKRLDHWGLDVEDVVDDILRRMESNEDADERQLDNVRETKDLIATAITHSRRPR